MSLLNRLRRTLPSTLAEPPQGWRGGLQLALHVLVTGVIVSVLLSLAVVGVAAQAAELPLASTASAPGDAYAPVLFVAGLGVLGLCAWLLRRFEPAAPSGPPSVEEALKQRARVAGWVC